MEIFKSQNDDENQENIENENLNNENNNKDNQNQTQDEDEKRKEEEDQYGLDGDYDLNESKIDEQLVDTDSENQSTEKIIQKMHSSIEDKEYHIYTTEFDETAKAETLETNEEILRLRKKFRSTTY